MLNVKDMYFHGVTFTDWDYSNGMIDIELVCNIFYDGYVLTRGSLEKTHPSMYRSLSEGNFNGEDMVSICCHSDNEKNYVYDGEIGMYFRDNSSAFDKFVSNNISLVFDRSILDKYDYIKSGMIGEYQILGDISLEYIRAIGIPNYFERICDRVLEILNRDDYLDYRYDVSVQKLKMVRDMVKFLNVGCNGYGYYEYENIIRLLGNCGFNVPIIDVKTRLEWSDKESMASKLENVRNLAISKKLIKM